jgi:hypothetical protein
MTERSEQRETHDNDPRTHHLPRPDRLPRQEIPERQRPDHRRHQQRLDDRDPTTIQRSSLQSNANQLRDEPEQPHPARQQQHERPRPAERDPGQAERSSLPKRGSQRETDRRKKSERGS